MSKLYNQLLGRQRLNWMTPLDLEVWVKDLSPPSHNINRPLFPVGFHISNCRTNNKGNMRPFQYLDTI